MSSRADLDELSQVESRIRRERDECEELENQIRQLAMETARIDASPSSHQRAAPPPPPPPPPSGASYGSISQAQASLGGESGALVVAPTNGDQPGVRVLPRRTRPAATKAAHVVRSPMYRPASPSRRIGRDRVRMTNFPQAPRFKEANSKTPGPGDYETDRSEFKPVQVPPDTGVPAGASTGDWPLSQSQQQQPQQMIAEGPRGTNRARKTEGGAILDAALRRERELKRELSGAYRQLDDLRMEMTQYQAQSRDENDQLRKQLKKRSSQLESVRGKAKGWRQAATNVEMQAHALVEAIHGTRDCFTTAAERKEFHRLQQCAQRLEQSLDELEPLVHGAGRSASPSTAGAGADDTGGGLRRFVSWSTIPKNLRPPPSAGGGRGGLTPLGALEEELEEVHEDGGRERQQSQYRMESGFGPGIASQVSGRMQTSSRSVAAAGRGQPISATDVQSFAKRQRRRSLEMEQKEADDVRHRLRAEELERQFGRGASKAHMEQNPAASRATSNLPGARPRRDSVPGGGGAPYESEAEAAAAAAVAAMGGDPSPPGRRAGPGRRGSVGRRASAGGGGGRRQSFTGSGPVAPGGAPLVHRSRRGSLSGGDQGLVGAAKEAAEARQAARQPEAAILRRITTTGNEPVPAELRETTMSTREATADEMLHHIFDYYASFGVRLEEEGVMKSIQFYKLTRDARILDPRLMPSDVDIVFTQEVSRHGGRGFATGGRMSYDCFVAALSKLGLRKFADHGALQGLSEDAAEATALRMILHEHLIPLYQTLKQSATFVYDVVREGATDQLAAFTEQFLAQPVIDFFNEHAYAFQSLFSRYAMMGDPSKPSSADRLRSSPGRAVGGGSDTASAAGGSTLGGGGGGGGGSAGGRQDYLSATSPVKHTRQELQARHEGWREVLRSHRYMSRAALYKFASDMKLVPQLLTRPDLTSIFREANRGVAQDEQPDQLSYPEFVELIAMVAYHVYRNSGSLEEGGSGALPTLLDKIQMLLFEMHENRANFVGDENRLIRHVVRYMKDRIRESHLQSDQQQAQRGERTRASVSAVLNEQLTV